MSTSALTSVPANAVVAYPYDDAIAALIHESLVDDDGAVDVSRSGLVRYNKNLFTDRARQLKGPAGALAALFERVILSARPVELPDFTKHVKRGWYAHPGLRLDMSLQAPPQFESYVGWMDYGDGDGEPYTEWDHLMGRAISLRYDRSIDQGFRAFFRKHRRLFPSESYIDFVINAIVAVNLASENNAILLGDRVFHEFYELLRKCAPEDWALFPRDIAATDRRQRIITLDDLNLLSLGFAPANLDAFLAIRASKDIRRYARHWRAAIAEADIDDVRAKLEAAILDAYERRTIRNYFRVVLESLGSASTWAGAIPLLGTIATLVGMAADLGTRISAAQMKDSEWCLLGSKMMTVASEAQLRKHLETKPRRRRSGTRHKASFA